MQNIKLHKARDTNIYNNMNIYSNDNGQQIKSNENFPENKPVVLSITHFATTLDAWPGIFTSSSPYHLSLYYYSYCWPTDWCRPSLSRPTTQSEWLATGPACPGRTLAVCAVSCAVPGAVVDCRDWDVFEVVVFVLDHRDLMAGNSVVAVAAGPACSRSSSRGLSCRSRPCLCVFKNICEVRK